jgi:hypothetical protein
MDLDSNYANKLNIYICFFLFFTLNFHIGIIKHNIKIIIKAKSIILFERILIIFVFKSLFISYSIF